MDHVKNCDNYTGCGKLASFFHIALSSKKEVSLPHRTMYNVQSCGNYVIIQSSQTYI
jgi:hypothetical protein